jgi:CS domain
MHNKLEEEKAFARRAALLPPSYLAIDIPRHMGMDCGTYRWKQSQSHVEIFLPLPENITASKVSVTIKPGHIAIEFDERPILKGQLYKEIKADESTWYIQDRVLEIVLLKRNRKGNYQDGTTNADTFWKSVVKNAPEKEVLALEHPPTSYYWAPCEDGGVDKEVRRLKQQPSTVQNTAPAALTEP